jgi:ATP-binding cassette subfamily B protein
MEPFLRSNGAFLRHFLRQHWKAGLFATLCSILLGFVSAMLASLVGPCLKVLSHPQGEGSLSFLDLFGPKIGQGLTSLTQTSHFDVQDFLHALPFLLAGIALLRATLSSTTWYLWEQIGEGIATTLRMEVTRGFLRLRPAARQEKEVVETEAQLSSIVTSHIKLMKEFLTHFYGGFPRELLQMLFLSVTLILLSPSLFLLAVCGVLPAMAVLHRLGKKIRKRAHAALSNYTELTEWLQQRLFGIETIKHLQTEPLEIEKFEGLTTTLTQRFYQAIRAKSRTSPLLEITAITAMALVLGVALEEIHRGTLTGPAALSFFTTLAMIGQSASIMGRYFNSNRDGAATVSQIRAVLATLRAHEQEDVLLPTASLRSPVALACKNVYARYPTATGDALQDFSYEFERGKLYSIMGPSGSGKSTLFKVILSQLTPHSGHVFLSDQLDPRTSLGYLPQQLELFTGTVAENIAYPQVPDLPRVEQAGKESTIEGFIQKLPQGYETLIGPRGVGISGGQIQRILLARLFYHTYPIILIDEGTSALDPETEATIYQGLQTLSQKGACILLISHRTSVQALVHEEITLNGGRQVS